MRLRRGSCHVTGRRERITLRQVDWRLTRSLTHLLVLVQEALSSWGEVTADVATLKWILEEYGVMVFPAELRARFS